MAALARVTLISVVGLAVLSGASCASHPEANSSRDGGAAGESESATGVAGAGGNGTGGSQAGAGANGNGTAGIGVDASDDGALTGAGGAVFVDGGSAGSAGTAGAAASAAPPGSPVALHGTLQAKGSSIVGSDGMPVQLKGMSFYWSQDPTEAGYYNADVVAWLVQDWHVTILRAAIAVTGKNDGDYLSNPTGQLARLDTVVQAAVANGIYVLVDWHDSQAPQHLSAAKTFFDTVSQKYSKLPNVIYEIWNEPLGNQGLTWTGDLKPYAETISAVIRGHDETNLMIAGTPFWDQQPDAVIGHEVQDPNVAYTLHFYAGSPYHHLSGPIGTSAKAALAAGIPLFVTEWGSVDPVNQGAPDETETRNWMTFLDQNHISSCNWSISDKNEGSAALRPGTSNKGHWSATDLTASGALAREIVSGN